MFCRKWRPISIDDRLILAIILLTLVVGVSIGVLSVLAVNKWRRSEKITLKTETEILGVQEDIKPDPHAQGNRAYGHVNFKQWVSQETVLVGL